MRSLTTQNKTYPVNSTVNINNEEFIVTHDWKQRNEKELVCLAKNTSNEYVLILMVDYSYSIKEKGNCAIIEYKLLN